MFDGGCNGLKKLKQEEKHSITNHAVVALALQ